MERMKTVDSKLGYCKIESILRLLRKLGKKTIVDKSMLLWMRIYVSTHACRMRSMLVIHFYLNVVFIIIQVAYTRCTYPLNDIISFAREPDCSKSIYNSYNNRLRIENNRNNCTLYTIVRSKILPSFR